MRRFRSPQAWRDWVEERATRQLQRLVQGGLWDRRPPVPVEHVVERFLGLSILYEEVNEPTGTVIFGCLRPETRTLVLNERHLPLFQSVPGLERFTLSHEAGHADLYALAATAHEQERLFDVGSYHPWRGQASGGPVQALRVITLQTALRGQPREVVSAVYEALHREEQAHVRKGQDTPLERRAVDRYAAALLMPADLMREAVRHIVRSWAEVRNLAVRFGVSTEAMTYRLRELGLAAPPVVEVSVAAAAGQGELF